MRRLVAAVVVLALIALSLWQFEWDVSWVEDWIDAHRGLGALAYIAAVMASVVALPFSSLPLLPLATRSYGVLLTALLSALGWWLGALLAFQIARLGRRYLERVTSLDAVDRLEGRIPPDIGFGGIVLLRILFPVDLVSYALGLLKRLSFTIYAVASAIGVLPFALVWSYAGGELGRGHWLSFAVIALVAAGTLLLARRLWRAH